MNFIEEIKKQAKQSVKTIVLPEGTDIRVIKATETIKKEGFANVILLGDISKINSIAKDNNIDIEGIEIINPCKAEKFEEYANSLYELRKNKGLELEQARELVKDETHFGMMMVKLGDADGLVSGAIHPTADTLRPALQILKTAPDTKLVSTFFVMTVPNCEYGENGLFIFSDCGIVENPDEEQLSEIAISSAKTFKSLIGKDAKVAMLSYSTKGSANSEMTQKVINATNIAKTKQPNLAIEGELQLDAAIIPEVAQIKCKDSNIAGHANVLIFPDLNAGNIGYKLVQRLAKAEAYGPLCQGIAKPVNDLSRGCSENDIVGVVAITAVQSITNIK